MSFLTGMYIAKSAYDKNVVSLLSIGSLLLSGTSVLDHIVACVPEENL